MSSDWNPSFLNPFFELFLNLRKELLPWVASIIMVRVLINLAMFKSVSDMGTIIKDVFFGMILLCFFVEIIKFSQMIPNVLNEKLSRPDQVEITLSDGRYPFWTLASYLTVGAYWVAKLIYMLFIALLIATGAFVVIAGTMLAQRYLLNLFFVGLFGASLMPLVWFSINEAMKAFARTNEQSLSNFFVLLGGELIKIGIPLAGAAAILKNPFSEKAKMVAKMPLRGPQWLAGLAGKYSNKGLAYHSIKGSSQGSQSRVKQLRYSGKSQRGWAFAGSQSEWGSRVKKNPRAFLKKRTGSDKDPARAFYQEPTEVSTQAQAPRSNSVRRENPVRSEGSGTSDRSGQRETSQRPVNRASPVKTGATVKKGAPVKTGTPDRSPHSVTTSGPIQQAGRIHQEMTKSRGSNLRPVEKDHSALVPNPRTGPASVSYKKNLGSPIQNKTHLQASNGVQGGIQKTRIRAHSARKDLVSNPTVETTSIYRSLQSTKGSGIAGVDSGEWDSPSTGTYSPYNTESAKHGGGPT